MTTRPRIRISLSWHTAMAVGIVATLLLVLAGYSDRPATLRSYLFAWWFLLGIPLGSMAILMVHNLTGGAWGELIRPALDRARSILPFAILASLPLWFGLRDLFAWARPGDVAASPMLQAKAWYLDPAFFALRAAACFVLWLGLSYLLRSERAARFSDPESPENVRLRAISSVGLLLYGVTITFAAVDWIMSLSPEWYSTTFGLLAGIGQAMSAFALAIAVTAWRETYDAKEVAGEFHDLGNLLLMFVMVWAYLAFMQYLIIWSEDLPDEIAWYLPRVRTTWRAVAIFLIATHFAVPFLVLLSRRAKRVPRSLALVAALLLASHLVDAFWLIVPTLRPHGLAIAWSDPLAVAALGGIGVALFLRGTAPTRAILQRPRARDTAMRRIKA